MGDTRPSLCHRVVPMSDDPMDCSPGPWNAQAVYQSSAAKDKMNGRLLNSILYFHIKPTSTVYRHFTVNMRSANSKAKR
jgi:hypothetical protein